MSLPLHTHAAVAGVERIEIRKVVRPEEAGDWPEAATLIWTDEGRELVAPGPERLRISGLKDARVVQPGDVIRLRPGASLVSVLYRRASKANSLFITERCNSLCVMCSQPPRDENDDWRIAELLRVVRLADRDEIQLGITGGEPTLVAAGLAELIDAASTALPNTGLHILTNGRRFADRATAERLAGRRLDMTVWAVPLYADVARIHDDVVQAENAFEDTLQGLYELGRLGARIELRVVLHKMTYERLPQLAAFIYRRLPFVEHVALMGLEPMGFAKGNRDRLWIDPVDYLGQLHDAVFHLHHRGVTTSIYNLPLCVLPAPLWPFAQQSISDWKNTYPAECGTCVVKDRCAGFFASAGPAWRSRAVKPIIDEELAA